MTLFEPTKTDKLVPIVAGLVLLAFLACVPAMWSDKQQRLEQAWQEKGCQMYDNDKPADLPAKCSNDFVDHYQPQEQRNQPTNPKTAGGE